MNNQLVFAFDGDGIGKRHARAILSDDLAQVREVSEHITEGNNFIREFVEQHGGEWVSGGGDEGSFVAPSEFLDVIEQMRKDYEYVVQATLSVGFGQTISQAGKALLAAKARGKDQVVQYDETVEQEIQQAQGDSSSETDEKDKIKGILQGEENARNTSHSVEASPPVHEDNNHGYDSGYNSDSEEQRDQSYEQNGEAPPTIQKPNLKEQLPVMQAVSTDIPESNRPMNQELPDPKDSPEEDKKPDDKFYHGQAESAVQTSEVDAMRHEIVPENQELLEENGTMEPGEEVQPSADMPSEDSTSNVAEDEIQNDMDGEDKHCPSCTCEEHAEQPIEDLLDQHIDNAQDMEQQLDNSGDDTQSTEELLDQHIENAQDMDQNGVARPADFNTKDQDMGLSEEEAGNPDLSDVLKEGLDNHADNIQREKVMQMVGQALDAFKSQKSILDKAREQAPELHDACISMLRAMIELCSLAGIDQSQPEQEVNEIESGENPEERPGEEQQVAQPPADSEEESTVGNIDNKPSPDTSSSTVGSVKKLPSKSPTPHVVKETTPVGGVNAKGQKRYIDPTTGKDAYIDMKTPRVMGPRGIPIKG